MLARNKMREPVNGNQAKDWPDRKSWNMSRIHFQLYAADAPGMHMIMMAKIRSYTGFDGFINPVRPFCIFFKHSSAG